VGAACLSPESNKSQEAKSIEMIIVSRQTFFICFGFNDYDLIQ
jgi:hypothetical protein